MPFVRSTSNTWRNTRNATTEPREIPEGPLRVRTPSGGVDPSSWRDEFPVVKRKAYLISASLGPVSRRSRGYLDAYIDAWASKGAPDQVWFEDIFPTMRALKQRFAALAGCHPDELAITTNISVALSTIASCVDFSRRRKVILSELDFPTDGHVWLAQRSSGAEVVFLKSLDGLTIPRREYERAIDRNTAVVMVNRVLYRTSALERYSTRFTMTTAVFRSMARSYSRSGIVRPSSDFRNTTSAPLDRCASQTCPSVGKSSSDRITLRRLEKSTHDAIVESATEMFVVMASSSGWHPANAAKRCFNARMVGKMSSNHTWSGAPLEAHASMYASK